MMMTSLIDEEEEKRHNTKHRAYSQKYLKIVLLLFAVVASQWIVTTNTRMISSLMLQFSVKKGRDNNRASDHYESGNVHQQVQFESTTSDAMTSILIHYHKTGNNFVVDLLKEIHRTY